MPAAGTRVACAARRDPALTGLRPDSSPAGPRPHDGQARLFQSSVEFAHCWQLCDALSLPSASPVTSLHLEITETGEVYTGSLAPVIASHARGSGVSLFLVWGAAEEL